MEYLFLIIAFIMVLLGIYLIFHTLHIFRKQRRGELKHSPNVDIGFMKLKIKGGRPIAIFVLGILLLVLPLKYTVDVMTHPSGTHVYKRIVPVPNNVERVAEASEPSYEGFRIKKDIRVIDLRSRISVPENKKDELYSPITWTRYTLLQKLSKDKDYVNFEFATTGPKVTPRCLTHDYIPIEVTGSHRHGDVEMTNTWQLRVDVKNIDVGKDILIVNEATYWNGFAGEKEDWASMAVSEETDSIAMVVLFPDDKPFISHRRYSQPHDSKEIPKTFRGRDVLIPSENSKVLVWKIEQPREGYAYQLDWTW